MEKLNQEFYQEEDVLQISKDLLGKTLYTQFNGKLTSGVIVETEAYAGVDDMASHAYGGRRTKRTETMYAKAGTAYVYLCYGIHHLFNVVTNIEGIPHAVLIRAIEPLEGIDIMLQRRKMSKLLPNLTAGPGILSQALGISIQYSGISLLGNKIWINDIHPSGGYMDIISSPRVGCQNAGKDANNPWRFRIKGNKWVSPAI
ncbi:MAG: DNA-3-methyladenine glycosylase [Candidatus Marinimicrobia bacterium]|nr:DNA-3-methyladenine glycosylase [Candidatus Neomarinimicrobiota bacterium]